MIEPGIEYYRYIQPNVYSRLVEGYASDEFWNVLSRTSDINKAIEISRVLPELADRIPEIADLLEKKPFVDWYAEVADYVSELVKRTRTLSSVADQLVGVVVETFFSMVGDLVGVHDNLMWYGDTRTVSAAYDLFGERTRIIEVTAALHVIRDKLVELNADLFDIRDSLKRISSNESALTTLVGDKTNLHWVAGADVKSVLESFVTGGVLPTIKENAYFDKNVNALGTLTLGKPIGLAVGDPLKPLADISPDLVELNKDLHGIRSELKTLNTDLYSIRGSLKSLSGMETDITTLVGDKTNLHWVARKDVTLVLEDLVSRGILPTIKGDASFEEEVGILGMLSLGKPLVLSTTDPLKPLADISTNLVSLNADLYGIRGNLKDLNTYFYDIRSELKTLNTDLYGIRGNLKDFVSKGILPEIKEPAKFLKDMDILGKLNLLERVKSRIDARFNALDFTVSYDFTDKIFYPGPFDAPTHFWFNNRFVGLTGLRDWADWIKKYMTEFADVTIDKHRDKIVDAMLIFSQGVRSVVDCFIDIAQNIKSWVE